MEGIAVTRQCGDQYSFCWPPLMELMRDLRLAAAGDVLSIVAEDRESKEVIPVWIARAREELLVAEPVGNATRFIVRKTH